MNKENKELIKLIDVKKKYKSNEVLNIDKFKFIKGESYLLIGANGSGKSTLIKIIVGLIKKYSGKVIINTSNIGYMPEKCVLPAKITIENFLKSICKIRNLEDSFIEKKLKDFSKQFNLDMNKRINALSKGMLQKVSLIQTLIHTPDLYIFDEPLNGLDYNSQKEFIKMIKILIMHKKTIIIATHFEKYYHNICQNKIYINGGKISEKLN